MKKLIVLLSVVALLFLASCFKKEETAKTDSSSNKENIEKTVNTENNNEKTEKQILESTGSLSNSGNLENTGALDDDHDHSHGVDENTSTGNTSSTKTNLEASEDEVMAEFEKELEELFKMVEEETNEAK